VGETALRVGYESEAAFSKAFKQHFGQSPYLIAAGRFKPLDKPWASFDTQFQTTSSIIHRLQEP
jgi:AraC-like DNA-binding protein